MPCDLELIESWAQELLREVHHYEANRQGILRGSVNGQVARVQFIVKTRERLDVRRHARLGL